MVTVAAPAAIGLGVGLQFLTLRDLRRNCYSRVEDPNLGEAIGNGLGCGLNLIYRIPARVKEGLLLAGGVALAGVGGSMLGEISMRRRPVSRANMIGKVAVGSVITAAGLGAAAAATGVLYKRREACGSLESSRDYNRCSLDRERQRMLYTNVAVVGAAAGALLLGYGAGQLRASRGQTSVSPTISRSSVGLQWSGSF